MATGGAEMNKVSIFFVSVMQNMAINTFSLHLAQWDNGSNRRPQQPLTLAASSCDPHG